MERLKQLTTVLAVIVLFAVHVFSDTLVLKSGDRVTGYYEGGSARVIKFRGNDGVVKDYDILSVQQVQFGDTAAASAATKTPAPAAEPRLVPGSERVTRPVSSSAA